MNEVFCTVFLEAITTRGGTKNAQGEQQQQQQQQDAKKAKKKKKRKTHHPAKVMDGNPDPERWIRLKDRSYFKKACMTWMVLYGRQGKSFGRKKIRSPKFSLETLITRHGLCYVTS